MIKRFLFILILGFSMPMALYAATDLSISAGDIQFSTASPLAGQDVRIYATITNGSQQDARASVRFLVDGRQIGNIQPLTVVVGKSSTVFIDWQPREGYYDIEVDVISADPGEGNTENNKVVIQDFLVDLDTDNDGTPDTRDMDDDGDGIADGVELINGTNPINPDTDGDGVSDNEDAYPNDPTRQRQAEPQTPQTTDPAPSTNIQSEVKQQTPPAESPRQEQAEQSAPPAQQAADTENNSESEDDGNQIEEVQYTFPDPSEAEYELDAMIAKSKLGWNKWEFEVLGAPSNYVFLWNFGDGTYNQDQKIIHSFPGAGEYEVALSVSDEKGGLGEAKETIDIGFWSIGNLWVKIMLGGLALLSIALTVMLIFNLFPKIQNQEEEE